MSGPEKLQKTPGGDLRDTIAAVLYVLAVACSVASLGLWWLYPS